MSTKPNVLVLTGFGLNCDHETAYAFELAGAVAKRAHINALIAGDVSLDAFQILAFGGGFSWGDDHGAGVIQALRLKTNIGDKLLEFVAAKKLIIGICNGFQTLVNLGLLPGNDGDYTRRTVALTGDRRAAPGSFGGALAWRRGCIPRCQCHRFPRAFRRCRSH